MSNPIFYPSLVVTDLDGTLYDYELCHESGITACSQYFEETLGFQRLRFQEQYQIARNGVKKELGGTASSHSRLLYLKRFLDCNGHAADFQKALLAEKIYWDAFLHAMACPPGVIRFLKLCQTSGIDVVIATDFVLGLQIQKVERLGIENYICGLLSSEETGADKPHKKFSEMLNLRFGSGTQNCWVIGDSEAADGGLAESLPSSSFFHVGSNYASIEDTFTELTQMLADLQRSA